MNTLIISKRKNLRNKLGVLQILLITFLFLINVSTVFALSRTEAENYSKKISGADKYSIFASSEKIRILGFLRSDSSSESFFGSNRNFSNVIQVKAGSDFAALITSNNVLKLFGNYKKFISTDTLTNVKQVALGQEHLAVLNLDGTLKVYGNVDLNKRIYGIHRYATAASVSREKFVSSKYVVIVSGESYADALYAVPLARALRAPILLTRKTGLPAETISELKRLSPTMVYIIGGYSIIDSTIENQIANELKSAPPTRKRIAGSNRYETSVLVARELARVLKKSTFHKVYLTVGTDFADALSVSPLAASEGVPVLLVNKYGMPSSVSKFLSEFKVGSTIVIGGTDIFPDAVIKSAPKPTRIYGANKYIRSTNIANYAINNLYFDPSRIYIATGENFPDALVAGVLASIDRNVLLLV
ncbi:MAG: cell wall-binding repeat-containing protein, partial [Candidatus Omnitrophica bacterium]|nr:cell wall-binding repeat-containing protein [Candidatus Omnitrophota bacterium]